MSPEFWFVASGTQRDQLEYNITMAQVIPQKLNELHSIIETASSQNMYEYIKSKLIEHFAD